MTLRTIAVTGATGNVGSRVVRRLADVAGERHVVALARDPGRTDSTAEPRRCDYDDPDSINSALEGVDALVFVSSDGEADVVLRHHLNVVAAVAAAGVRRVAYLSSLDADPASPFCYGRTNGATERALLASPADVRIVRAGLFLEFLHALMGDGTEVRAPGAGRVAPVSRADVADALVEAVLDEDPRTIRTAAAAHDTTLAEIAAARGQSFVPVDLDTYRSSLVAGGEDPWWSYAYASLMQAVAEDRFAAPAPDNVIRTARSAAPSG